MKRLAFIAIIVSFILIVFGGYVSSSESGMGCGPEWPLCNGEVIPSLQGETLIEFAHRVIGAVVVLLYTILFFKIRRSNAPANVRMVSGWMMGILLTLVVFGAIVVILDLPAIAVTIHLLLAIAFFTGLIWIWRSPAAGVRPLHFAAGRSSAILHLNFVILLLVVTFGLGGYVKHEYYGLSCGWLSCGESWLPLAKAQIFQTLHRLLAAVSAIYILALTYAAFKRGWGSRIQNRLVFASAAVLAQLAVGVLTIVNYIPLPLAVLHLAVGTFLFAIVAEARIFLEFSRLPRAIPKDSFTL